MKKNSMSFSVTTDSGKLMRKNFIWNTMGSTLYACTSLFFMIIVTRINGIEQAGIFTFGFSFACMIQVVALFASRTYQVTERDKSINDYDYIYFKIITCLAMVVCAAFFIFLRDYETQKILIMWTLVLYKCLDAFAEVFYGIFQKHDRLYQVGISFTIKATVTTAVLLIVDLATQNLLVSCISFLIADLIIFVIYDIRVFLNYKVIRYSINKTSLFKLFIGGLSVCVFTFLSQYLINTQKYIIDFVSLPEVQAIFGIILMPATFMSLCTQLIINPFLHQINEHLKKNKYKEYIILIIKICIGVVMIGLCIFIACIFLGIPVLQMIYGIDLDGCMLPLSLIVGGSVSFGLCAVLSNALIAIRKNILQTLLYLATCFFSTSVSIILIPILGLAGAGFGFCLSTVFLFILLAIYFSFEVMRILKN